jgi:hypothetical protein
MVGRFTSPLCDSDGSVWRIRIQYCFKQTDVRCWRSADGLRQAHSIEVTTSMGKLLFLLLGLLFIFYVAWPAWSIYRIYDALERNDAATLERKIDFASVRDSLKPAIRARVDKMLDRTTGDAAGRLRDGRLRQQVGPQLMETALNKIVTPQSIASLYAWRGDISQVLKDVKEIREIETATDEAGIAESAKPSPLGLSNIKRFAFTSLTSFEIGIAKDASSSEPDLTVQMGFRDMDWKLIGLVPKVEGSH